MTSPKEGGVRDNLQKPERSRFHCLFGGKKIFIRRRSKGDLLLFELSVASFLLVDDDNERRCRILRRSLIE